MTPERGASQLTETAYIGRRQEASFLLAELVAIAAIVEGGHESGTIVADEHCYHESTPFRVCRRIENAELLFNAVLNNTVLRIASRQK
ncbi:UNVERIFIED_CONTAM: hypothetical protein HHA_456980 [Hammondia hammondi]|eukprot:XP_008888987.1 hypothetical protein HHA_456980 [Hammondia hammondi]